MGENGQHKFWLGCRPWGAGTWRWHYPHKNRWRLGCPALAWGKPQRHLALVSWQNARLAMAALEPHGAWENSSAIWRLGGSDVRGRPKRHLALGSWQKAQFAMAAQPPHDVSHFYYNIITYNKNSIIYTTTDNIFSIHSINYK